jgi:primase-polymerase (primpol)-like protein
MNDLISNLMNLPIEMRRLNQFLLWCLEYKGIDEKTGKDVFKKEPYSAITHWKCDATNEVNWVSLETALEAYRLNQNKYTGVGFSIKQGGGIFCVDIDDGFDEQGALKTEAQEILNDLPNSFIEISQSGSGLHYWGQGHIQAGHLCKFKLLNDVEVEVYSHSRYIAVTGNVYQGGKNLAC